MRAPAPTKGLTFRKGKREANVHDVKDGVVFYGVYLDGDDRLATQAGEHGAEVFTMVRSNAQGNRRFAGPYGEASALTDVLCL